MPGPIEKGNKTPERHIDIQDDNPSPRADGQPSPSLTNSRGWDGKLRVQRTPVLANPEAISDPEYSDDDNVIPGEEISADEGGRARYPAMLFRHTTPS